jgi:hypothetical protein
MTVEHRSEDRSYERQLQETRRERHAEEKRVERLSSILAKKVDSTKAKDLPDQAA